MNFVFPGSDMPRESEEVLQWSLAILSDDRQMIEDMWTDRVVESIDVTPNLHPPALVWALQLGHTAIANYLIDQGADISLDNYEALYLVAKTPHHAKLLKAMLKKLPSENLGQVLATVLVRHQDIIHFNVYALIDFIACGLDPNLKISVRDSKRKMPLLAFVIVNNINLDVIATLIKFGANRDWFNPEKISLPPAVTYLLSQYNPQQQSDQCLKKHFKSLFIENATTPQLHSKLPVLYQAILNSIYTAPDTQFNVQQFLQALDIAFSLPLLQPGLILLANACMGKHSNGKQLKFLLTHHKINQHFFGLNFEANASYTLKNTIFQAWSTNPKTAFKTWLHESFHFVIHIAFQKNRGLPFFAGDSTTQRQYLTLSEQVMKHSKLISLKEIDLSYENHPYQHAELPARSVECIFDERLREKFISQHSDVITYFETVINPAIQRHIQSNAYVLPEQTLALTANM